MVSQEEFAAKGQELQQGVAQLAAIVNGGIQNGTPIHEVEKNLLAMVLKLGKAALGWFISAMGDGDCGEVIETAEGKTLQRSADTHSRPYVSVFGAFVIDRFVYAQREGQKMEFAEVDARLALPESHFSYLLQDFDQSLAVDQPFAQVSKAIEKILGLDQHVDSLERMNRNMAESADAFHAQQAPPPPEEEGAIFVQTADGKGVPIRRPADAPPIEDHAHRSGPKPDRKKMATVGAVYSVDPVIRTPEDVVESLFREPQKEPSHEPKQKRPRPCHKEMRAMLNHTTSDGDEVRGRAAVFGWIADRMQSRHGDSEKPIVNIMDGEEALWNMRDLFQPHVAMTDVLDLLHVTPRLWNAAGLFHSPGGNEAKSFVRERVLTILKGGVDSVICGLRRMATTHNLSKKRQQELERICGYFKKNRERMRYDEYLRVGYPIASGVIEGACRYVVKDRLERTGMSWVPQGAQSMLELRCIYLTGQWDAIISYRIDQATQRLYPYRDSLPSHPWTVAA
jgi:hypothetical protein